MAYRLNITRSPTMTVAQITALASREEAEEIVMAIEKETREHQDTRLLIDLTDYVGTLDPASQRWLGELVVVHLSHLKRVASLVGEDKITRLSEQAAQERGVQLRVFTELTAAVSWLLEAPAGTQ